MKNKEDKIKELKNIMDKTKDEKLKKAIQQKIDKLHKPFTK